MNRPRLATMAMVLSLALFAGGASASAKGNCHRTKGRIAFTFDPVMNTSTGEITRGGWLNGTTLEVYHGAVMPTAHPTTVSYASDFTVTTKHGQLKLNNVTLFNFVTGNAAVLGHIDPAASTDRFAGATGVLYVAGETLSFDPFIPGGRISGEVCFAKSE